MELSFQADTFAVDGMGGTFSHILIDQRSWRLSHLVIQGNRRAGQDWLVPLRFVASAAPTEIRLTCTLAQLRRFEPYTLLDRPDKNLYENAGEMVGIGTYAMLEASVRQSREFNLPPSAEVLYWGTQVMAAGGQIGQLDAVRFEPQHQMLAALVIQQRFLWSKKEFAIPARHIERIEPGMVHLNVDRRQIEALPDLARRSIGPD